METNDTEQYDDEGPRLPMHEMINKYKQEL